jgi:diguanylate cyclase
VHGVGSAVVAQGSFGPWDHLSDWAHQFYTGGYSDRAVVAALEAMAVAAAAGDERTVRYLHYTRGVALIELRRWDEAIDEANLLAAAIEPDDVAWRAKALSLLGDASLRLGRAAQAVDALAEAYGLVQNRTPQRYNDLSAATGVATVLGHAQLFEPADALFTLCLRSPAMSGQDEVTGVARVIVLQDLASLHAAWGAALDLDGRPEQARTRYLRAAEVALAMMAAAGDAEMYARGSVIEAFVQQRLGQPELGAARLRDAMTRFDLRRELPEVLVARLGLAGQLTREGDVEGAREQLTAMLDGALVTDRVVWELSALAALAENELAAHGPHPAAQYLQEARRTASHRLWAERESRFFALQDRLNLRALAAQTSHLTREALIDPLTGLGNRRMLDAGIADSLGGAALFVDVDLFKAVNDTYSHAVGDEVLRRIADILRVHCRSHDVVVRFGGDEFVVLLPTTGAAEAAAVGERVRSAVAREDWDDVGPGLRVSVSVGVASGAVGDRVVKDADAALFEAKSSGRNRVAVH